MAGEALHDAAVWDARSEVDMALMIRRYLAENPPPPGAIIAGQWEEWSGRLLEHGQARLAAVGATSLRTVR